MTNTEQCLQDYLRPHELDGMRRASIKPISLDGLACWGRAGDAQCDDCTLRIATYSGSFPDTSLLVPDFMESTIDGQPVLICCNRRSAGTPRPAAVCAAGCGAVGAAEHGEHVGTLPVDAAVQKPLETYHPKAGALCTVELTAGVKA